MTYAFYISGEAASGIVVLALLAAMLAALAVNGIIGTLKLERSKGNVRHRSAKQNSDL